MNCKRFLRETLLSLIPGVFVKTHPNALESLMSRSAFIYLLTLTDAQIDTKTQTYVNI